MTNFPLACLRRYEVFTQSRSPVVRSAGWQTAIYRRSPPLLQRRRGLGRGGPLPCRPSPQDLAALKSCANWKIRRTCPGLVTNSERSQSENRRGKANTLMDETCKRPPLPGPLLQRRRGRPRPRSSHPNPMAIGQWPGITSRRITRSAEGAAHQRKLGLVTPTSSVHRIAGGIFSGD
jgi:hypothetical protein